MSRADEITPVAGTPAYMAPEQVNGSRAHCPDRSLRTRAVMYEAFTGRRAITARNADERRQSATTSEPVPPSEFVHDLPPSIERVIIECLNPDSTARPASALVIAAALPGDNPIAAALAAGRLPSAEMIAASRDEHVPSAALAWTLFVAFMAAVLLFASLNGHMLNRMGLTTAPAVLVAQARAFAREAHPAAVAGDTAYWFTWQQSYLQQALNLDPTVRLRATRDAGQLADLRFIYRQSPYPLAVGNVFGAVLYRDPPADVSRMVDVNLDLNGRLLRLVVVPDIHVESSQAAPEIDWNPWISRAGLADASLRPVPPVWTPPVSSDKRQAWEGEHPQRAGDRIHVTAASFHGRPVYFDVIDANAGSGQPVRVEHGAWLLHDTPARVFLVLTVLGASILLARRHLLRGQGDRRGAVRLGLIVLSLQAVAMVRADHVADVANEYFLLTRLIGWSLYSAMFAAMLYLAFEPFVRRRWPMMLIAWTRSTVGTFLRSDRGSRRPHWLYIRCGTHCARLAGVHRGEGFRRFCSAPPRIGA